MQEGMYCPKCGAPMKSDARYCMKCGCLNANHEANKSIKEYINYDTKSYEVGSGKFMIHNSEKEIRRSFANGTGNKLVCFLVNYGLYLLFIVAAFYYSTHFHFSVYGIMHSFFPILSLSISLIFLYTYSLQLVFMKCNRPWWAALIPIYNMMILADIVFEKKWLGLLTIIPGVGVIFLLVLFYQLGKSFEYNGVLSALFPFIYIPLMAFDVHSYKGYIFVDNNSWFTLEREYVSKRICFISFMIFFFVGFLSMIFTNYSVIQENIEKINNYYYVYVSRRIVSKVKIKTGADNVLCDGASYDPTTGRYYFYFDDVKRAMYVPFSSFFHTMKAYVLVDNNGGESEYYISITNGTVGFPETKLENVKLSKVQDYTSLQPVYKGGNMCHFID